MKVTLTNAAILALLAEVAVAAPTNTTTYSDSPRAGSTTTDSFPPAGTTVNSQLFPPESVVGFPQPTPTGAEPAAAQTAALYPYNNGDAGSFPLTVEQPHGAATFGDKVDITKYWGNLSPWYSVDSADYGLPNASPLIPSGCTITQMHLLYRHGARYPTTGAGPSTFSAKVQNATMAPGGFKTTGEV